MLSKTQKRLAKKRLTQLIEALSEDDTERSCDTCDHQHNKLYFERRTLCWQCQKSKCLKNWKLKVVNK